MTEVAKGPFAHPQFEPGKPLSRVLERATSSIHKLLSEAPVTRQEYGGQVVDVRELDQRIAGRLFSFHLSEIERADSVQFYAGFKIPISAFMYYEGDVKFVWTTDKPGKLVLEQKLETHLSTRPGRNNYPLRRREHLAFEDFSSVDVAQLNQLLEVVPEIIDHPDEENADFMAMIIGKVLGRGVGPEKMRID